MALNRAEPLELVFRARADNIFVSINNIPANSAEVQKLLESGIILGDTTSIVATMEVSRTVTFQNFSVENNNTNITWFASVEEGQSYQSIVTTITIVGE